MLFTVVDLLVRAAETCPDKKAVLFKNRAMTYGEICEQSRKLAGSLVELGVKKGDRVCFYLEKRLEKVLAIYAISIAGAVFVPIRRLCTKEQALYIINNSQASVLITTSARLAALAPLLPELKAVIVLDYMGGDLEVPNLVSWEQVLFFRNTSVTLPSIIAKDIAAIMYTSGSTGPPKGVVLTHGNIVAGAYKVSHYLELSEHDRLLGILSFGFDYGLNQLTMAFMARAQLVLFDYLFPRDILKAVGYYGVTGLAAVATTWIQLLQVPWGRHMDSLRYITNSGGAIPVDAVRDLRQRIPHARIYLMYGLTEAFRSTYLEPDMVDLRPDSIGKAVPGEEVMVVDENDMPVKPGEIGELVHRGELVAQGYWADSEATVKRFRKNPFLPPDVCISERVVYSGDYVRMDDAGYLYFVGRKDEMIKSAGNRISPWEVEEILYRSGFVSEVVAMGISHEVYGQVVCVVLALLPGVNKGKKDILDYCKRNMPLYMVPHEIQVWDTLPQNTNGKLDRAGIRERILKLRST